MSVQCGSFCCNAGVWYIKSTSPAMTVRKMNYPKAKPHGYSLACFYHLQPQTLTINNSAMCNDSVTISVKEKSRIFKNEINKQFWQDDEFNEDDVEDFNNYIVQHLKKDEHHFSASPRRTQYNQT